MGPEIITGQWAAVGIFIGVFQCHLGVKVGEIPPQNSSSTSKSSHLAFDEKSKSLAKFEQRRKSGRLLLAKFKSNCNNDEFLLFFSLFLFSNWRDKVNDEDARRCTVFGDCSFNFNSNFSKISPRALLWPLLSFGWRNERPIVCRKCAQLASISTRRYGNSNSSSAP